MMPCFINLHIKCGEDSPKEEEKIDKNTGDGEAHFVWRYVTHKIVRRNCCEM